MKRIIYIIIGITACLTSYAAGFGSVKALPQDSATICRLLAEAKKQPASTCMPLFFAQKFVGILPPRRRACSRWRATFWECPMWLIPSKAISRSAWW